MESDPYHIKEVHGFDVEELRGHEKKMMQHHRELAAATRGKADRSGATGRGSRGQRNRDAAQYSGGGASTPYPARKPKKFGGGKKSVTCYECYGNLASV